MSFSDGIFQGENFVEILEYRAQTQAQQTAFTFLQNGETPTESLTYQELSQHASTIARKLIEKGMPGDRVVLLYRPSLDFIAAYMGCLYAGQIAVPVNPPRRIEKISKLEQVLQNCEAQSILTTQSLFHNLQKRVKNFPLAKTNWIQTDRLSSWQDTALWKPPRLDPNDIAMLQYTSGSTGVSKGVMVTHKNLIKNAANLHTAFHYTPESIRVNWLPVFHDMGLMGNVLQTIYEGIQSVMMSPFDFVQKPLRWLHAISKYKATHSGGPNFSYDLLCQAILKKKNIELDLSSWEVAYCGAEMIQARTIEQFAKLFKPFGFRREAFYPCYGMAEATLFITGHIPLKEPKSLDIDSTMLGENKVSQVTSAQNRITVVSCGQPRLDTRVAIVNPETSTRTAQDRVGEVWVAGSMIGEGYWNQIQATRETFHAYLADGDGPFLRTGDLGFLHNQELFITGRLKENDDYLGA